MGAGLQMMMQQLPLDQIGAAPEEQRQGFMQQCMGQLDAVMKQIRGTIEQQLVEYKENKEMRDAAAFQLVDVSGDGTLQLSEVMEILKPGNPKEFAMKAALGFPTQ